MKSKQVKKKIVNSVVAKTLLHALQSQWYTSQSRTYMLPFL